MGGGTYDKLPVILPFFEHDLPTRLPSRNLLLVQAAVIPSVPSRHRPVVKGMMGGPLGHAVQQPTIPVRLTEGFVALRSQSRATCQDHPLDQVP